MRRITRRTVQIRVLYFVVKYHGSWITRDQGCPNVAHRSPFTFTFTTVVNDFDTTFLTLEKALSRSHSLILPALQMSRISCRVLKFDDSLGCCTLLGHTRQRSSFIGRKKGEECGEKRGCYWRALCQVCHRQARWAAEAFHLVTFLGAHPCFTQG